MYTRSWNFKIGWQFSDRFQQIIEICYEQLNFSYNLMRFNFRNKYEYI